MKVQTPNRIKHSYTQNIQAPPSKVFPLLCPVREIEWVVGWNPLLVVSKSGFAELDCLFVTKNNKTKIKWFKCNYPLGNAWHWC